MKLILSSVCFLSFLTLLLNADSVSPEAKSAIKVLSSTHPFENKANAGAIELAADRRQKLYDQQIRAINCIGENKLVDQVSNLIPFLDYISNGARLAEVTSYRHSPAPSHVIRQTWPTYNAILEIPSANIVLKKYILDKANPINYRIAAFLVLRDADSNAFEMIKGDIDQEFIHSKSSIRNHIKNIENGSAFFWGVQDLQKL